MHPHAQWVEKFYSAFQKRDAAAMADCYAPGATFSDPVFLNLKDKEISAMWRMLCERGKDLSIEFNILDADDRSIKAHWDAVYTFSATGRRVRNSIDAYFEFKNGKIILHRDSFNLWKWTRMALGFKGWLLGWSPLVQNVVRKQARKSLEKYIEHERIS